MHCSTRAPPPPPPKFPEGLRVLVVDDDPTCLKIIAQMLRACLYKVTTCPHAEPALSILRGLKGAFDLVLTDVYMPDMDGFKLLEHIGLEMDLPVIMMSAEDKEDVVMKGVTHGACDYLIKPVRMEAIKNIWQHVVRKKRNELDCSGSVNEIEKQKSSALEDGDNASSSVNEESCKGVKRRKEGKEGAEADNRGDSSTAKKPRVVWSVELHRQFVAAVTKLGVEKAVPKKILELMNVPGLSRENVASHLQKYRLYLKRVCVPEQKSRFDAPFTGATDGAFGSSNSLEGLDLQVLAISGRLPPQNLISAHAGPRRVANTGTGMSADDQISFLNSDAHTSNSSTIRLSRGQLLNNNQMNLHRGTSANIELSQLGQSQPAVHLHGNMDLKVIEGTSRFMNLPSSLGTNSSFSGSIINSHLNNSFIAQMSQQAQHFSLRQQHYHIPLDMPHTEQFRGQLLNGFMGEQTTRFSSIAGQQSASNEIMGQVSEEGGTTVHENIPIDGSFMNTFSYGAVPQAQFDEFQNSNITKSTGNCFSLANNFGASSQNLRSMFQGLQPTGITEEFSNKASLEEVENLVPNYDIFSEDFQSKSLDWRLQNVNPYESAQHIGSQRNIIDFGSSDLVHQDLNATLKDDNRNRCIHTKEIISVRTEIEREGGCIAQHNSRYVVENSVRVKAKTISDSNCEDVLFADNIIPHEVMSTIGRQPQGNRQGDGMSNFDGYPLDDIPI